MCTLSIITTEQGYLLGMNRDEVLSRSAAALPAETTAGPTRVAFPRDIEGGTWIGVNEHRISFALLNWYAMESAASDREKSPGGKAVSRGFVIPDLAKHSNLRDAESALRGSDLRRYAPFRVFGAFPYERAIREWKWDGSRMEEAPHPWKNGHWFSSGLSQAEAERQRGEACLLAASDGDYGTAAWLRRLHASHANGPGPFSVCVHRESVATLSYTEIECNSAAVVMRYFPNSLCERHKEPAAVVRLQP